MTEEVSWLVELAVKPGKLADFEKLTGEMVAATRVETGVLAYERFVADDDRLVHVYERYASSAAAVAHLQNFGTVFGDRFASMVRRKRFTVYGNPTEELRALLDRYHATYFKPFGPFAYWA
jgi:quinol monooxygenase YgiN